MENALLIGLSRQAALQRQMDVIANNLANMETPGYKGETLLFEEYLPKNAQISGVQGGSSAVSLVQDVAIFRQFSEGSIVPTSNPLDIAINGKGWLVVETPDGERYTRNGHLGLNDEGILVNSSGYPVRGLGGNLSFGSDEINLTIASDGTVSSSEGEKGKLRIVQFDNEHLLKKDGETLYKTEAQALPAENVSVTQGMIERSNVQPVLEMTKMIEVMRSYIATSKMNEKIDELKRRGIEQLGTLS